MRTVSVYIVLIFLAGCREGSPSLPLTSDSPATDQISIAQLNEERVIGRLGVPMGNCVEIQAEIISGDALRMKGYDGKYLLRPSYVDGVPFRSDELFEFHPLFNRVQIAGNHWELFEQKNGFSPDELTTEDILKMEQGYVGKKVSLLVYECGSFGGLPRDLPKDYGYWADRSYSLKTWLSVLADTAEQRDKLEVAEP